MDSEALIRRLEREKKARREAESLLETKSLELYKANVKLSLQTDQLEERIAERTEHLNKALAEARSASRVKRQFISNISHELRTPLNGVLGTLQLLAERPADEAQKKLINHATVSAERLKVLISDMLDMSRLESGAVQLDEYEFNFGNMLRELVESFVDQAKQKGVSICLSGMANSDLHVIADPVRLRQILFSLLDNAIKFTEQGCIHVHVGIKDVVHDKLTLFVSVTDSGVGIAADKLESIFEHFTQADDSANRRYQGAGLGLATSSQLLQMMDARLNVSSELGVGSTFWFRIPVRHENAVTASPQQHHVLLVAPYDGDRSFTVKDMAQSGIDVSIANDSQEMLEKLAGPHCDYDVVLIDERITSFDKDIFAKHFPEDWRQRAVLLCLSKQKGLPKAISHRFVSVLERPMDMALLNALLCLINEAGEIWQASLSGVPVASDLAEGVTASSMPAMGEEVLSLAPVIDAVVSTKDQVDQAPETLNVLDMNLVVADCWRGRVLLVEDNHVNALIAIEMLKVLGIQAEWVVDGSEAIKVLQKSPFALILMDCQMPIMDGYEATRRIRAGEAGDNARLIPIVALTADNPRQGLHSFMMCDMNGWLPKPLEGSRLALEMKRHLLKREYASDMSFDARLKNNHPLALALLQHWQQCLAELTLENNDTKKANTDTKKANTDAWIQDALGLLVEIADALDIETILTTIREASVSDKDARNLKGVFVNASSELKQHIKSKLHAIQEVFH